MSNQRRPLKTLTAKEQAFLQEFPKDQNATQAAIRAGYSKKTAQVQGAQLLKRLHEQLREQLRFQKNLPTIATSRELAFNRYLQEIERLSYYDARKLYDSFGNPKEIPELGDDEAAVIAGFEVSEQFEGKGESRKAVGYVRRFKLSDKIAALSLLGKVRGFYYGDVEDDPCRLPKSIQVTFVSPNESQNVQINVGTTKRTPKVNFVDPR
jgi:phage terminase small subunit